jgi:competence protein ComEC
MKIWNQAPIVRLLLPFLIGIIAAIYYPFQHSFIIYLLAVFIVVVAAIVLINRFYISYKKSYWFGFIVNGMLFLLAYQLTIYKTEKFSASYFSAIDHTSHLYYARLHDPFIEKEKSLKAVVDILAVKQGNKWMATTGKALMYFKKDSHSLNLNYGDELVFTTRFKEIAAPQNPDQFNYKRFLSFHNISEQGYVNEQQWKSIEQNSGNALLKYAVQLRTNLLQVLAQNGLTGDEYSVGAALLLGYIDKLDADIITAYSSTGALHVLSVSGLHVAIVYLVFSWLLFFLDKIKYGFILKAILLLLFLWFYAMLTGLSPSVLRAATMFSFIIIANAFNRHTNIYNTLAASALFLLVINPYLIMEVGFQLSYLAVIGIVYLQPKIHAWFEPQNWLLSQVWTITAVSIAAQIATFPLGLHYFHQFPNYFLLSNLIVIPISTVIIYVGIALFTFSKIPFLVKYLAIVFTWTIWLLNASVKWVETLPNALLQGVSISVTETWLLYGFILVLLYYFAQRNYQYLVMGLMIAICILCLQVVEQHQEYNQKQLVVYNIPKTSAIDFIDAKSNVLLTDTAYANDQNGLLFHVKHHWWELGVNATQLISANIKTNHLSIQDQFIQFFDKKIKVIDGKEKFDLAQTATPLPLDYVIISNSSNVKIEELQKKYTIKTIIFDSSNSNSLVRKWKEECNALNQVFYSVMDSGAFVANL